MSGTITNPTTGVVEKWFDQDHVTIAFTTVSGSHYTLVKRPGLAVLVRDNTAEAWKGQWIKVIPGSIQLGSRKGIVWETTGVVSFFVLSN